MLTSAQLTALKTELTTDPRSYGYAAKIPTALGGSASVADWNGLAAAADINKLDAEALAGGDPTTSLFAVGTTSTGYTSTGEGTITAVRMFDVQFIAPTKVNAYCYCIVEV